MRIEQPAGRRGSLKWLQRAVNDRPALLQPPSLPPIRWLSPLRSDGFAEYRDAAFLEHIGESRLRPALAEFWPARGPQWDALGVSSSGPVLVEAKAHVGAHVGEFLCAPCKAQPASRRRIARAFAAVQAALHIDPPADWTRVFFQYANRLAHLWFLRAQGVDATLLFVGFLGDDEMRGPNAAETWNAVFDAANHALGIPKGTRLLRHVRHVNPHVRDLAPDPPAP